MRKTKIVCTMGPSVDDLDVLKRVIDAGMNVARLNMSHGSHGEHAVRIGNVRKLGKASGLHLGIMLDTKGPEIRLRTFESGTATINSGDRFVLSTDQSVVGSDKIAAVSYLRMPKVVKKGDTVLINDGKIDLVVESVTATEVRCTVRQGGVLSNRKAINLPNVDTDMQYLSDTDREDIKFGISQKVDFIALSFVRNAQDVQDVKEFLKQNAATHIKLISKIENRQGVDNLSEILKESDGIMVARGDMGVEIPFQELPWIQKHIIKECNKVGKISITATQMLESMMDNPRPTRAEVSDVANAVFDGTSATMLSGESAAGKFPVEAVFAMVNTIKDAERGIDYRDMFERQPLESGNIGVAVSYSVCSSSFVVGAKAILVPTETGRSARDIARFMPGAPIVAICTDTQVATQLSISWGVTATIGKRHTNSDELFENAMDIAAQKAVKKGDTVILSAGVPVGRSGHTNTMRIEQVS